MLYLYHRMPLNMKGNILYPLNLLKEKYPQVYNQELSKYNKREYLLKVEIPPLNCLWNDALHLSAVNPKDIKNALLEAGADLKNNFVFYQIDPNYLDKKNTTVYLYRSDSNLNQLTSNDFESYNHQNIEKYSKIPNDTKEYYKELISMGKKPLLFYRLPHILYKGTIDVTGLSVISV